jgi:hypothetical protein
MRRASLVAIALLSGCYHVGVEPVDGLQELAVPMFDNRTLRRDVEVALTRHVRRELLETTPLHLAREGAATRTLRGAVVEVEEQPLIVGASQEVLHGAVSVTASFGVFDQDGARVVGADADGDGRPEADHLRVGYAEFARARGETREGAVDEALRDIAEMVVQELTARADDRFEPNDAPDEATPLRAGRQHALVQRDADLFRVVIPPGLEARVTLFAPEGPLRVDAVGLDGAPLADARPSADGREVAVTAGAEERTIIIQVTGDDAGTAYQLRARLVPGGP